MSPEVLQNIPATLPQGAVPTGRPSVGRAFAPLLSLSLGAEAALLETVGDHSTRLAETAEQSQVEAAPGDAQSGTPQAHDMRTSDRVDRTPVSHGREQSRGEELRSHRFEPGAGTTKNFREPVDGGAPTERVSAHTGTPRSTPPTPDASNDQPQVEAKAIAAPAVPPAPLQPGARNVSGSQTNAVDSAAQSRSAGFERTASAIRVVGEAHSGSTAREAMERARTKPDVRDQSGLRKQSFQAQVGRGLAAALKQKGGVVTLRLKPETMGQLLIRLELDGGRVRASFQADHASARDLLASSMDALRTALEARGLTVERLQVEDPAELHQEGAREGEERPRGDEGQADRGGDPQSRPRSGWRSGGSSATEPVEPTGRELGSEAGIAEGQDQALDDELRLDLRVGLDAVA